MGSRAISRWILVCCSLYLSVNGQSNTTTEDSSTAVMSATITASSSLPTPSPTSLPDTPINSAPSSSSSTSSSALTTASLTTGTPPPALLNYLIILGVTTGFFLLTTALCTVVVLLMCCRRSKALRELDTAKQSTEGLFEGSRVSPHWINTPTPQLDQLEQSAGTTDLPIWSVKTFETRNKYEENSTSSLDNDASPNNPISANNPVTVEITPAPEVKTEAKTRVPKRVAPPPPKKKSRKKAKAPLPTPGAQEGVVYDVPVTGQRWFSRRKKMSSKSKEYKELNVNQLQAPNTYATPQVKS